jgi:hypothetical protein
MLRRKQRVAEATDTGAGKGAVSSKKLVFSADTIEYFQDIFIEII